ncbi:MAG: prolyl oligopeptidase family serine peptidase [Chloroflexi bacterium]|nr:prolyl oligopeptidase family serine peptidase [Chloroflexota bacterium]
MSQGLETIQVDGRDRTYIVYTPDSYATSTPMPLVIVLHGGGGHAENAQNMSQMNTVANREGFIVVYPNGNGRLRYRLLTWNAADNCCGYAHDQNVDDVKFIRELIEQLQKDYAIDPNRIYVTGMSNGGMMSYKLACALSDVIAAIAPVSGAFNLAKCEPTNPVSVIIFHGTADEHVLYDGGSSIKSIDGDRVDQPVSAAVDFWTTHDGCATEPASTTSGSITTDTYTNCNTGAEVTLVTIDGGGHAWPGGRRGSRSGDQPSQEINASEVMWQFFTAHPRQ